MRSMSESFNTGHRIGSSFMGGLVGNTKETPAATRAANYDVWTRKEIINKGLATDYDLKKKTWSVNNLGENFSEADIALSKQNRLKQINQAYDAEIDSKIKILELGNKIETQLAKSAGDDRKSQTTTNMDLMSLDKHYKDLLGPELYEAADVAGSLGRQKRMVKASEAKEETDIRYRNMLSASLNKYMVSGDLSDLSTFDILWNKNPEIAKDSGYPNPTKVRGMMMSDAVHSKSLEREAEKAKIWSQSKTTTDDQKKVVTSDGSTEHHNLPKGTVYVNKPDGDIDIKYRPKEAESLTETEKDIQNRTNAVPKIQAEVDKNGPMSAYKRGWRMNDDGTLFTELDTGAAVKLPSFNKVAGKRSATKEVIRIGELWDDAEETMTLLADPLVMQDLGGFNNSSWGEVKGKTENEVRKYLQRKGLTAGGGKTIEAIARISEYASRERQAISGAAVTEYEMKSLEPWLPNASDSYEVTLEKMSLAAKEGKQAFVRWMDIYKDQANMAPIYEAFGIDRFGQKDDMDAEAEALIKEALGQ